MRSPRIRSNSLNTLLALLICFALLASGFVPFVSGEASGLASAGQEQSRGGSPEQGPPATNLPNLNEARRARPELPVAPAPIPSTMRSRRNPLAPRNGRRVGDPGTLGATSPENSTVELAQAGGKMPDPEKAIANSGVRSKRHMQSPAAVRFSHARATRISAPLPPPIGDDQFVQNFFQLALARQPSNPTEQVYWNDILRAAYARGQNSMVMAVRELGKTLFESSEYAGRGRSDHWYV